MAYTPLNAEIYTAAYSGALSGMAINGWITSASQSNYSLVASIAGAFAEAFDQTWGSFITVDVATINMVTKCCHSQLAKRSPGPGNYNQFLQRSNWTAAAAGIRALVSRARAFIVSEGISIGDPPGTTLVWQPNGPGIGPNMVVNLSEVASLLTSYGTPQVGTGKFVIDGSFVGGIVTVDASAGAGNAFDLKNKFDVELKNVDTLNWTASLGNTALFINLYEKIQAYKQCRVVKSSTSTMRFATLNPPSTKQQNMFFKNIIWDVTAGSGEMIQNGTVRTTRLWFEDCSLQPNLTTPRANDRLLLQQSVPNSGNLEIFWYGPNAGQITAGNTNFMNTTSVGFTTSFTYGVFGGPLISLAGINWAAAAPTIVNRQP